MLRALLNRFGAGVVPSATRALLLALAGCLALAGQEGPGRNRRQVQFISLEQFQAMVRAGTLVAVTPRTLAQQRVATLEADRRNRDIVEDYLRRHPGLTDLARLVKATPDFGPRRDDDGEVRRTLGDGYAFSFTNKSGQRQTVQMMGQANKLLLLAHSIQELSRPAAQLQLYTTFYNQLPAGFCRPAGIDARGGGGCADLPSPAALRDAPLATLRQAVRALAAHASEIIAQAPIPAQFEPIGCPGEVGDNPSAAAGLTWGDQTDTVGCPAPSPEGIYANVNFLNKGLLSCIKNQGHRGTCHIFAATSALEELVARDTGTFVNLSEQDFQEHVKLLWATNPPDVYGDSGSSWGDISDAAANHYQFAYENQWDYNPSLSEPVNTYINTCVGYPGSEPGCSDTAPQAPEYCVTLPPGLPAPPLCGFELAALPGARSPYTAVGASDVWNAADPTLTFNYMILGLALNNAVLLGFNVTNTFEGAPNGYVPYEPYDLGTSVGGHMVHVVGYVPNQDLAAAVPLALPGAGGGYFIIKNSWGACTGDAGYYYMPVAYLLAEAGEVDIVSSVGH
ncbi:MAG TPA: C1 family peptidase [Terriglobales bacterium]|nr:C1 family peptidase [Terriglobales bacterium]